MAVIIFLYLDALVLNYYGILHIKWFAWLLPLWYAIGMAITKGILLLFEKYPVLSLPVMALWVVAVFKFVFSLGIV
jgi:hypothetical protein